jgi:hypothetical protein
VSQQCFKWLEAAAVHAWSPLLLPQPGFGAVVQIENPIVYKASQELIIETQLHMLPFQTKEIQFNIRQIQWAWNLIFAILQFPPHCVQSSAT